MKNKEILIFLKVVLLVIAIFLLIIGKRNCILIAFTLASFVHVMLCIPFIFQNIKEKSGLDTVMSVIFLIIFLIFTIYIFSDIVDVFVKNSKKEIDSIPIFLYLIAFEYHKQLKLKKSN